MSNTFKVQPHNSVCNVYANFRKCMQSLEKLLTSEQLLRFKTPPIDHSPFKTE